MMILTIFFLVVGFTGYANADKLFEGNDVTTLGAASIVMILVNAYVWPRLLEDIQEERNIMSISDDLDRCRKYIHQLDIMVHFCSQLNVKITELVK